MSKPAPLPTPTAAELDLLRILWQHGPLDARAVHDFLALERADASYATVLRQLQLMHGKGLLSRDESRRPQLYSAVEAQAKVQTSLLKDLIGKVFAGSGKALVLTALREHVSDAERLEIEKILSSKGSKEDRQP
ncbi:BlaI/MecI/CopY family transcriptional regulator [Janthinobacterium psychrotolerans]|uniref:Putative transcriptional regulator n=1 Tax=Janthinobacterium psychrotolerans TaxID=1747903 RepID=A0A1A7C5R3_9BURK|nr:BlaI/MecI/CopY family transcriptional regulator [Janthinobacterium psychrotolerans]OBV39638.1 putative transcriptional regulator [Janthinobacterium psychrotolerans]